MRSSVGKNMELNTSNMKTKKIKRKVSICAEVINNIDCGGKYSLSYDVNAPIFICEKCGNKNLTWKKFYDEYLQLFKKEENWNSNEHKISCIIGFFCYKYKEKYEVNYTFVPSNPNPYSSKECKDAWSVLAAFSGDANKVRKYMVWLFKNLNKNTNIISFGYLKTQGLINKYNLKNATKDILHRESKLPMAFLNWCKQNCPKIFENYTLETMNDLGAILGACKTYKIDKNSSEHMIIEEAKKIGLIKLEKLNIN
jgi:hypothetical protein